MSLSQYYSEVLIVRNATNTSVTLNSIPYVPDYYSSVGVTQFDLIKSPLTNEFEVSNFTTLFEFPRGSLVNTLLIASVDQQYLFAASATSSIVKLDISNSNTPLVVNSSNLLGPIINIGVNDKFVVVLVANHVYDLINDDTNCSLQLFDIDSLLLIQTIPLPSGFTPTSLAVSNQSLIVGGYQPQSSLFIFLDFITYKLNGLTFITPQSSYPTEVVLDQRGTYDFYVGTSNGTVWKMNVLNRSLVSVYNATAPILQVNTYPNTLFINLLVVGSLW